MVKPLCIDPANNGGIIHYSREMNSVVRGAFEVCIDKQVHDQGWFILLLHVHANDVIVEIMVTTSYSKKATPRSQS